MGWSRAVAAVIGVSVLSAGVAGCTGDDPGAGPSPSPSASVSTSVPPTPEPTAAPVVPVLPAAAKEPTEAGARAFIAYYWALINYAQVTGDVKGLEGVSGPNCDGCRGGINAIEEVYRAGGHASGGEYSAIVERLKPAKFATPDARAYEGLVHVRNDAQIITRADGSTRTLDPTRNTITVYLLWIGSSWRMDVLVVQ